MSGTSPPMLPPAHPHQFVPFGQDFAVYRSLDGAGGLTTYWYWASNGASTEGLLVDVLPINTVLLPMKVREALASPDGVDETAAVTGAASVEVLAPADGVDGTTAVVASAASVEVLALADGVDETAAVT